MPTKAEKSFRELMRKIDILTNIGNTLSWDMRVMLPKAAASYRAEEIALISSEVYTLETSHEMRDLICSLEQEDIADPVLLAMVKKARRLYDSLTKVSVELVSSYAAHNLKTELVWQQARKDNDFSAALPYLKREFEYKRELINAQGFAQDPVTGLMDEWERGTTRAQIDALFEELKTALIPFVKRIADSGVTIDRSVLSGHYPIDKQKAFCHELLQTVGYDFDSGRADESAHPYTTPNHRHDERLTCRYFEDDFTRAALSSLHEGGHAMHWQNMGAELDYTTLAVATSLPIDESQSRFMENILGRSREFWIYFLPVARRYFPKLERVSVEELYRAQNAISITPIRLKADEITYNLHIILRYELEKALFDGTLAFEDLPEAWREKSMEYLGVTPKDDAKGVLQDMHWYSGYICYFQSYVLGNAYDGHFLNAMRKDIPKMFDEAARGEYRNIVGWNAEHIHRFASMKTPAEVLFDATGETLSAKHYIDYIKEKYTEIYAL